MSACNLQLLSAYVDNELDAPDRARVEQHVQQCSSCAAELALLRESSLLLRESPYVPLNAAELNRLHDVVNESSDQPILRLGFMIGALAASVLVVSCVWLMQIAAPRSTMRIATAPTPAWERVAMTLRAEPLFPLENDRMIRFADAQLADWMLAGLAENIQP